MSSPCKAFSLRGRYPAADRRATQPIRWRLRLHYRTACGSYARHSEQFAFIFDTQRVETDRFQLYTIDDPEDLVTREPLVAWFRVKGVAR